MEGVNKMDEVKLEDVMKSAQDLGKAKADSLWMNFISKNFGEILTYKLIEEMDVINKKDVRDIK